MHRLSQCIKKEEVNLEIQFTRSIKKVRFSNDITIHEVGNSMEDREARDGLQDFRERERFKLKLNDILINKLEKLNCNILYS